MMLKEKQLQRWSGTTNLSPNWEERTEIISKYIKPNSDVIEFGAGLMFAKKYLPEDCSYTPSDLVDRGAGTIICDLNDMDLPEFKKYDVAIFSGVLEYILDVERLISHLSQSIETILTSYATLDKNKRNPASQWVNSYTENDFISLFERCGFKNINKTYWKTQTIFEFIK